MRTKGSDRERETWEPEVADVFFKPGAPRTRRIFQRDAEGRITGLVDRREAREIRWTRVLPSREP